ncbi:MAG: phosphoglycerate kinase [Candidatus Colwellbacteria bacterium]
MIIYLIRLNLDIKERDFKNQLRFKLAISSIKSLSKRTNKIVVLSHLGRPNGIDKSLSLKRFAPALTAASGRKIRFMPHFNFQKIRREINAAPGGSIFLLENLRFFPGEVKNSKMLAKQLASLGDHYINDDFATSHRDAASISGITGFLPGKPGSILRKEIQALAKIRTKPRRPFVLIIGGAKMADKIVVMRYLLPKVDYILVGGGPANNFLKLNKVNIGSSIYEPKLTQTTKLLARSKKVIIPPDWKKEGNKILDIGPETVKLYAQIISSARTIIWNGPLGYFENRKFKNGTEKIAKAILKNKKAEVVIGGGETIAALPLKIKKQNYGKVFISTGGGAMLEFLAGKKLPGIESLRRKR